MPNPPTGTKKKEEDEQPQQPLITSLRLMRARKALDTAIDAAFTAAATAAGAIPSGVRTQDTLGALTGRHDLWHPYPLIAFHTHTHTPTTT